MANTNQEQANDMCSCGYMHGHMHGGHTHFLLHVLLGLIVLAVTFIMGLRLGEIKGSIEGNGYGMMGRYGAIMMRGYDSASGLPVFNQSFQTTPSTSTAPATPKK